MWWNIGYNVLRHCAHLGVVETTRASTSDKHGLEVPVVITDDNSTDDSDENTRAQTPTPGGDVVEEQLGEDTSTSSTGHHPTLRVQAPDALDGSSSAAPTAFFFSPTEEKNLELSGGNILSPAMSRQGSPSDERHPGLNLLHDVSSPPVGDDSGEELILLRRRGGASSDVPRQAY